MTGQRDNLYGGLGLLLGIAAVAGALVTEDLAVAVLGVCGLVVAPLGIWRAVQVDYGMSRSITGLLLSLFALAVWVFSKGGPTAV